MTSAAGHAIFLCCCLYFFQVPLSTGGAVDPKLEVPVIRDTSYPVPQDAYFVSVNGSDRNKGSLAEPFRTLTHAVVSAPAGATIVMRGGVYRESGPFVSKPLTVQPYPHEQVWLKGSVIVDGWTKSGSIWKKDHWPYRFDSDSYDSGAIDPASPFAGYPDMVFVDGRPLRQVGRLSDVRPGAFFADYDNQTLYIGDDPGGRLVEAAAYQRGLRVNAGETVIRGLGFMHYASGRFQAALQFDGSNDVTIENNTFAWSASKGLVMNVGDGAIVRGNVFLNNGQMGFGAWRYNNVLVEENRFAGNNQENFRLHGAVTEPAGAKITVGRNWTIRKNVFESNRATGLWLDMSAHNTTIVHNRAIDNLSYGIYYEISAKAIIASNLVVGNSSGIRVSNSSDVRIYNNTIVRNADNVWIQDDSRENTDPKELELGISHNTSNVVLRNNLLSNDDSSQNPFVLVRDYNSVPLKSADQLISVLDTNAYYRRASGRPAKLISWWRGAREWEFENLQDFRSATGHERDGVLIDDVAENPFFAAGDEGDYRLKPDSVAVGAGAPLPSDVAEAIGVPAGARISLGMIGDGEPGTAHDREHAPTGSSDLQLESERR